MNPSAIDIIADRLLEVFHGIRNGFPANERVEAATIICRLGVAGFDVVPREGGST